MGVKKDAEIYFKDTDPKELALAEQELIQEGTSRQEMKRLCDVHLEVMKGQPGAKAKKLKLPAAHPISILKDEHKIIKRNLKRLKVILEKLKVSTSFDQAKRQVNTLKELSHLFFHYLKMHIAKPLHFLSTRSFLNKFLFRQSQFLKVGILEINFRLFFNSLQILRPCFMKSLQYLF